MLPTFLFVYTGFYVEQASFETPYIARDGLEPLILPLPLEHSNHVCTTPHVYGARSTPRPSGPLHP